jgi:hypothetical protein
MNRFTLSIFLACLLAVSLAQAADEEDHAAHHPGADPSQAAPAPDDKAAGMKMEKMQDKMKKMQEQMAKIHATSDPKERERLMKEHMESMREGMKSMHAMMDKGGMGMMGKKKPRDEAGAEKDAHQHGDNASPGTPAAGGQGGEMMMGGDMMKGGMMKMHKKMQDRMDAMQKMMEQIIEHEAMEQEMKGK